MIESDLFAKCICILQYLLHEIQQMHFDGNINELHRMQKIVMLAIRKFIFKSINIDYFITRFVKLIFDLNTYKILI